MMSEYLDFLECLFQFFFIILLFLNLDLFSDVDLCKNSVVNLASGSIKFYRDQFRLVISLKSFYLNQFYDFLLD